jgi:hypothetical protein
MSEFVQRELENFYNLKWLDTYMLGHKGFIAGGCFKNIFNNEKVKDVDIFFESKKDYQEAKSYYDEGDDYHFYYGNKRVVSYKHKKSGISIELIKSTFGSPEEILNQFDFSIAKFAYYKTIEVVPSEEFLEEDIMENGEEVVTYKIVHHKDFFEHLHLKRLVVNADLIYPNSTFERMIRYIKYGYSPCMETKLNMIRAIRENTNPDDSLSESLYFGLD